MRFRGSIGRLDPIPEDFGLAQNMPNPFNPSTTISYEVPESGAVKLVVYNLLGQQVRTLVNDTIEAGFHSVVWDGADDDCDEINIWGEALRKKSALLYDATQNKDMMKEILTGGQAGRKEHRC